MTESAANEFRELQQRWIAVHQQAELVRSASLDRTDEDVPRLMQWLDGRLDQLEIELSMRAMRVDQS